MSSDQNQPLEILLTTTEYTALLNLLPPGYILVPHSRQQRTQQLKKPTNSIDDHFIVPTIKPPTLKRKAFAEVEQTLKGAAEGFKKCGKVLNALKRNENSGPFLEPVDPIALGVPTYFDVIKNPMDLSTVEFKLKSHEYETPDEFIADVRLIWSNAMLFNPVGSDVYNMAEDMSIFLEDIWKKEDEGENLLKAQTDRLKKKLRDIEEGVSTRNQKGPTSRIPMDKPLTYQEKKALSDIIRILPTEHLWGVWNIVAGGDINRTNEELEFDIETLSTRICRELEKYVKSRLTHMQKRKRSEGNGAVNDPVSEKDRMVFKEDTMGSENRVIGYSEIGDKNTGNGLPGGFDGVMKNVQPSFRVDSGLKRQDSSDSSFISDLDDSDA